MKWHPAYTKQQWEADWEARHSEHPPACRDCGEPDPKWHGAQKREVEGVLLHYRMCKRCGFWQQADSVSPPVRCWKSEHLCSRPNVVGSYLCEYCDTVLTPTTPLGIATHKCGKYLQSNEADYFCRTCEHTYGRESKVPWPRQGSG